MKYLILSIALIFQIATSNAGELKLAGEKHQVINPSRLKFDQGRFRFWEDINSKIIWNLEAKDAGTVEVIIMMANEGFSGSEIYVDFAGRHLKGKVIETGSWTTYQPVSLGEIQFNKGSQTLTLGALTKPSRAVMDWQAVILKGDTNALTLVKPKPQPFSPRPGRLKRLRSIHPSIDVTDISIKTPDGDQLKINGIDFLSDGTMVVGAWEPTGSVYFITNYQDKTKMSIKKFATGIQEPLGLKVVDDKIYILQKQEFTQLIDEDNDGVCDYYKCICNSWEVSNNFHEFCFGPVYKDGHFYLALAIAIEKGGATTTPQVKDRGTFIKIDSKTGKYEVIAAGLRTPNGIGMLESGDVFISDNQGDYLPGSKVMHMQKDTFFNHKYTPLHPLAKEKVTPPVAWLPHVEIGNSPTDMLEIKQGPFKGDVLIGDIHHGGLRRLALDKINGTYQGTIFRFAQNLRGGTNRIRRAPDGSIAIGINGSRGNWGHGKRDGLLMMKWNDKVTFEMKNVLVQSNGLEIEFTKPLKKGQGWDTNYYRLDTWKYKPTINYGGPKIDQHSLTIKSASVSKDRKTVFLEVDNLQPEYLAHLILNEGLVSENDDTLFTAESWTTMNYIPAKRKGLITKAPTDHIRLSAVTIKKENPSLVLHRNMCASCHTLDGKKLVGPSFKGLLGRKQTVIDSKGKEKQITVDTDYIHQAITNPGAFHPKGYQPIMPDLSKTMKEAEIKALVEWIKSQK